MKFTTFRGNETVVVVAGVSGFWCKGLEIKRLKPKGWKVNAKQ